MKCPVKAKVNEEYHGYVLYNHLRERNVFGFTNTVTRQ